MEPHIAKWFGNKAAAVSLRFDDSHETHVKTVIPILNGYEIKGTFMVNPGRRPYQSYKDFWEKEVPKIGHSLGNHTWNHHGAETPEEAEYEIGSTSRLIWPFYPNKSKLLVFACGGGGKKWGGEYWRNADTVYKELVEKYHLIDLYDGNHSEMNGNSKTNVKDLCRRIDEVLAQGGHQQFVFHQIREPFRSLEGIARYFVYGYDISFSEGNFRQFIKYLNDCRGRIWIGTLIDILKYETEYNNSRLETTEKSADKIILSLKVACDTQLYDHSLTVLVPETNVELIEQVTDESTLKVEWREELGSTQFDVLPMNSTIHIKLR